jgi:hypothetical protein
MATVEAQMGANQRKRRLITLPRAFAREHAYAVADELHDPKACPLPQTVVMFGDHLGSGIYYDAREVEMYMGLERASCAPCEEM